MSETRSSGLDLVKLLLALVVLLAGLVAFYYFKPAEGEVVAGLTAARIGGLVLAVILSLLIVSRTAKGQSAWSFMVGSRVEVRKMVWPTRAETIQTTIVVVIAVIILSIFLYLVDQGLSTLVEDYIVGNGKEDG